MVGSFAKGISREWTRIDANNTIRNAYGWRFWIHVWLFVAEPAEGLSKTWGFGELTGVGGGGLGIAGVGLRGGGLGGVVVIGARLRSLFGAAGGAVLLQFHQVADRF